MSTEPDGYDAADNSAKCYDLAISTMREQLESFHKVEIGDAVLYRGDCREILPLLPKVDAVVTDPPYGIGFKYASHDDSAEGYGVWLWSVIEAAESLCSPGAPVFVWQAMLNARRFAEWFPREWRLFAAAKNFVQMRPIAMQYAHDPVVVWWVEGQKPWSLGTQSRDFHIANTAPVIATPDNIERGHPCPRPLDQVWHIINQWVRPGSVVLDPFMGSGTTGVAAVKLGRKFIGIEIDEGYFEIACKRIRDAYAQPDMLVELEKARPVEQLDMLGAAE